MEEACAIVAKAHYTERGTGNHDSKICRGTKPHKVSMSPVQNKSRGEEFLSATGASAIL